MSEKFSGFGVNESESTDWPADGFDMDAHMGANDPEKEAHRQETISQLEVYYGAQKFQYGSHAGTITDIIYQCPAVENALNHGFEAVQDFVTGYEITDAEYDAFIAGDNPDDEQLSLTPPTEQQNSLNDPYELPTQESSVSSAVSASASESTKSTDVAATASESEGRSSGWASNESSNSIQPEQASAVSQEQESSQERGASVESDLGGVALAGAGVEAPDDSNDEAYGAVDVAKSDAASEEPAMRSDRTDFATGAERVSADANDDSDDAMLATQAPETGMREKTALAAERVFSSSADDVSTEVIERQAIQAPSVEGLREENVHIRANESTELHKDEVQIQEEVIESYEDEALTQKKPEVPELTMEVVDESLPPETVETEVVFESTAGPEERSLEEGPLVFDIDTEDVELATEHATRDETELTSEEYGESLEPGGGELLESSLFEVSEETDVSEELDIELQRHAESNDSEEEVDSSDSTQEFFDDSDEGSSAYLSQELLAMQQAEDADEINKAQQSEEELAFDVTREVIDDDNEAALEEGAVREFDPTAYRMQQLKESIEETLTTRLPRIRTAEECNEVIGDLESMLAELLAALGYDEPERVAHNLIYNNRFGEIKELLEMHTQDVRTGVSHTPVRYGSGAAFLRLGGQALKVVSRTLHLTELPTTLAA